MGLPESNSIIRRLAGLHRVCRAVCLAASIATIAAPAAHADGGVFAAVEAGASIPDQQALIHFDPATNTETLAIETRFEGQGDHFAWVVPVPSKPEVSATTTGLFPTLRRVTKPVLHSSSESLPLALTLLILASLGLLAKTSPTARIVMAVLLALGYALLRPAVGKSRGGADDIGVDVLAHQRIGSFDVATLAPATPSDLCRWLDSNGFAPLPGQDQVVQDYIDNDWVFVASKLRRDEASQATLTPHPLLFRFATSTAVYPMRLTRLASPRLNLDLYVFGLGEAKADGFERSFCGPTTRGEPDVGRPRSGGKSDGTTFETPLLQPELARLVPGTPTLTRLYASLAPDQMARDVALRFEPPQYYRKRFHTERTAGELALNAGLGAALLSLWALSCVKRKPRTWPTASAVGVLLSLVIGLGVGAITQQVIPTTAQVVGSHELHYAFDRSREAANAVSLADLPLPAPGETKLDVVRRAVRDAFEKYLDPAMRPFAPREEDSFGNYALREVDGRVEMTIYFYHGEPWTWPTMGFWSEST